MSVTSAPTTAPLPPPPSGRRWRLTRPAWVLVGAAVLVGLLLVALFVVIALSARHRGPGGRDHVVTGPSDGRDEATVELLTGATAVTVRAVDLGGPLYRVRTPDDARQVPQVTDRDGLVQVQLGDSGRAGPSTVEIDLATVTRWRVRLLGGATRQVVDLSAGRVAEVALVGGATSVDLTLPRPAGNVPVRMESGVATWAVHAPAGVPVSLFVGSGAGTVTIDGATRTGIAAGTPFPGDGWADAKDRYELTAAGGMSTFALDRR
jgi:hypothetical protein